MSWATHKHSTPVATSAMPMYEWPESPWHRAIWPPLRVKAPLNRFGVDAFRTTHFGKWFIAGEACRQPQSSDSATR